MNNQFVLILRALSFTGVVFLFGMLSGCLSEGGSDEDDEEETVPEQRVSFSVEFSNSTVDEGQQNSLLFTLSEALDTNAQIAFTLSGSASANDYESIAPVQIDAGETSYTLTLQTNSDNVYEGDETVTVEVELTHTGPEIIENSAQEVAFTIIDLNLAPTINVDAIKDVVGVEDTVQVYVMAAGEVENNYSVVVVATYRDTNSDPVSVTTDVAFTTADDEALFEFDLSQYPVSEASELSIQVSPAANDNYRLGGSPSEIIQVINQVSASVYKGSPFGVAPSHASAHFVTWWQDPIRQAGIDWIRGYDRRPAMAQQRLMDANNLGFNVTGILQWSAGDGFPDEDIEGWKAHVLQTLQNADPFVKQWEVWNEPPNFSNDKDPEHYAQIVIAAYEVVKNYDANMAVGLAASDVNLAFMDQALSYGAINHFDYVTVHPYPTSALMADFGYDAQYMAMVSSVKRMLQNRDPIKTHVPLVLTEVGMPILPGGQKVSDLSAKEKTALLMRQGIMAFKTYVLSLAQGIARVHWFQPLDNENQSFGLIEGSSDNWTPRPAYNAIKTLIENIGSNPHYIGWLPLGGEHTAYIFRQGDEYLLITWALPGAEPIAPINVADDTRFIDALTGLESIGDQLTLSETPIIMVEPSAEWIQTARENKNLPFLWQGDFTDATEVSVTPQLTNGLHIRTQTSEVDGETVFDAGFSAGVAVTVDPNFINYNQEPIRITVEARVKGDHTDPALRTPGFNVRYESPTGWKNVPGWNFVPKNGEWNTLSWEITDPLFVGRWGYHFNLLSDSTINSQYYFRSIKVEKL